MPRDATATRDRMIRTATKLFAERGIHAVSVRELTEAAGQRNTSALHYHFGSREGLLDAILELHQAAIDDARGDVLPAIGEPDLDTAVRALVVPLADALRTDDGREYLRVIAQVIASMDLEAARTSGPPNARRAVEAIMRELSDLPAEVRIVRTAHALVMVTGALANRARLVDAGARLQLGHDAFVADVVTATLGLLRAR
jgi:AcrR family transcriptional regulator